METFSIIFIIALILATFTQLWLARRHIHHINSHKNQVPESFADKISSEKHLKAAEYTVAGTKLGQINTLFSTLLLLLWMLGGGLNLIDQTFRQLQMSDVLTGISVILCTLFIAHFIEIPFAIYKTFVHEEKFGFNKTNPKQFIKDQLSELVLSLVILAPLLWVILTLMESTGEYWWLAVWLVWSGFSLFLMWAYPIFIAPLFNKFTPLSDETLKSRIEQLLSKCGFKSQGIFVMDGSKRSSHGNAYFTGFGSNKRIVFFDTLLESLSPEEMEAVLAHELGHFKRKHVTKRLVSTLLLSLAGLAFLGWLIQQNWFFHGLGIQEPSSYMGLFLFLLVIPVFSIYFQPVFSLISRKHEFEADRFAAEQTDAQQLVNALVKLYEENASTLTPDPLYSAFHDSHPPAGIRVAELLKHAQA
jgi:STE24 endopeptidase